MKCLNIILISDQQSRADFSLNISTSARWTNVGAYVFRISLNTLFWNIKYSVYLWCLVDYKIHFITGIPLTGFCLRNVIFFSFNQRAI
jgi:hypothetical protein